MRACGMRYGPSARLVEGSTRFGVGLYAPYAPPSMMIRAERASNSPSRETPVFSVTTDGWRGLPADNSSKYVGTYLTGRPLARARKYTTGSGPRLPLAPNEPPTVVVSTTTDSGASSNKRASASRRPYGDWQLLHTRTLPSSRTCTTQPRGSM